MEPLLIKIDHEQIEFHKKYLATGVKDFQGLYDRINALGFDVDLKLGVIKNTFEIAFQMHGLDEFVAFIEDQIKFLIGIKIRTPEIGGIKLSKAKILDMVELPDVSEIAQYVKQTEIVLQRRLNLLNLDYLRLEDGKISVIEEKAYPDIERINTYYTKNERGIAVVTILHLLCDQLNTYNRFLNGTKVTELEKGIAKQFKELYMRGIDFKNGSYSIDLAFVREQEESNPHYQWEASKFTLN